MKAEYRIEELNGKFSIETKVERIRYEGFFRQREVKTIIWKGVTIHGTPLFRSSRPIGIDNYHLKLDPFDTLEEAIQQIKEFKEDPVYYNETGQPDPPKFPDGNVPRMRNPPPPPPPPSRRIGDERRARQPDQDKTTKPPKTP